MEIKNIILKNRDSINSDLRTYWGIIQKENVIDKRYTRNYNIKVLYTKIWEKAEARIDIKLDSLCQNMGFKSRNDLPDTCIFPYIYKLSELNEILIGINRIRTIPAHRKNTKKGKKVLPITEELTSAFLKAESDKVQLQINAIKKKLKDFNDNCKYDNSMGFKFRTYGYTNMLAAA